MKSKSPGARARSNESAKSKRKSATQTGQGQEQEAGKGEGNKYDEHAPRQDHEQEGQGHKKVTDRDTCPPPSIPLGPASPTQVGPPSPTPSQRRRAEFANQYVDFGKSCDVTARTGKGTGYSISQGLDIDRALDDLRRQLVDEYNKQQTLQLHSPDVPILAPRQQVYAALTQAHNLKQILQTSPPLDMPAIERINDVINSYEILKGILQLTGQEGWTGWVVGLGGLRGVGNCDGWGGMAYVGLV
jgi:hypothetical protein